MAVIEIAPDGDVNVEVCVMETLHNGGEKIGRVKEQATFKVLSSVLERGSDKFKMSLHRDISNGQISIIHESIASMEIVFQCLHGQQPRVDVSLSEVWHVIAACDYNLLNIKQLESWYVTWYESQPLQTWFRDWSPGRHSCQDKNKDPRCLLFPTWRFDYAEGFLEITEFLVYNSESAVKEANPVRAWELRMPSRIIRE